MKWGLTPVGRLQLFEDVVVVVLTGTGSRSTG
jgi:hypothetical protein